MPVGADLAQARAELQAVVDRTLDDGEARCELAWEGGAFAPGETAPDHPWVTTVRGALRDELGREVELAGVPWGADMRLFTARGIPAVMVGTTGIELAHAVDESVSLGELASVARTIIRAVLRYLKPAGVPRGLLRPRRACAPRGPGPCPRSRGR